MALLDTGSELSVVDNEVYQAFLDDNVFLGAPVGTK